MDPGTARAALDELDARRRRSVGVILAVNGLLALGLAVFFVAPEVRCEEEPVVFAEPPPDPRDRPFVATREVTLVEDAAKIVGINFQDKDFFVAPRAGGKGWFYFNLAAPWEVERGFAERLEQRLRRLPVAEIPECYSPTPHQVKITLEGSRDVTFNLGEVKPEPDARPVFFNLNGHVSLISAADARLFYPSVEAVLGPTPVPIVKE